MTAAATRFQYVALTAAGQSTRGWIEAPNAADASHALRARGVHPIELSEVEGAPMAPRTTRLEAGARSGTGRGGDPMPTADPAKLSSRDLELFFGQLSKMVNAGLSLERALDTVAQGDPDSPRAAHAGMIVRAMRAGQSPSRAFQHMKAHSDGSTIALIRSGEMTGDLGPALAEIERLIVSRNQLSAKISTALIYPAILGLVSLASVMMILLVVIPQFEDLVRGHMDRMPVAAQFVFWLSQTVRQLALPLGLVALAVCLLVLRMARAGGLERVIIVVLGQFAVGQRLIANAQSAALLRMLGTLLSRQVLLLPAIDVAREAVPDGAVRQGVDQVRTRLKSGSRLAAALAETGVFTPITVQLTQVGEETGDLGGMLLRAAQMLEDDLERATKHFLIWFEPILLIVIGSLIGGLLYGLFSAILSINNVV